MNETFSQQQAITLVVTNSERLEGRSTSSHVFPAEGGTLGSGSSDDWLLQDHANRVRPGHAEIQRLDGRFCLIDRCGQTFVNRATLPIGRERRVALRDGDELQVGEYWLRVHMGDRQAAVAGVQPLATLVDEEHETLEGAEPVSATAVVTRPQHDPLEALGEVSSAQRHQDPMAALADETIAGEDDHHELLDALDGQGATAGAPAAPRQRGYEDPDMNEHLLNDLERSVGEQLEERWQDEPTGEVGHVGASPLLQTLGGELRFRDSAEQHAFLEEAGRTLKATVEGLLALHQAHDGSRYPLRDRRLQPIEDNPLRLGQSYDQTLTTLFAAQRSPVHLSAPAAVSECLEHQQQHQAAVEEAIGTALKSILDAFSPDALLKRFHAYRGAGRQGEDEGGWAWEMYRHYYQELNSGRQQGFEKLFWEVFEQAYDQSVRRQQREDA
ncbi:type VI secretion system-associated FHA domain protein TagH [Halomonas eurihalina]|uniref:Type VI secretion system-associated FHA domain protein TagH n=1 Tax=Halomonas eurihalina TaxID=42566 RepID=A0A5D9CMI3_HALER|nr:type VI secretion system-associated FHA domain protein TagH [Halomonas eurihalina]MDR5860451.1 type VI secretion system-associated FHA domain protein TagH [Halomonas eurihalina]TZG31335.1 type VI secretion system-associated FHA domain protein TagH [Halomonas eurihalina]